MRVLVIDNGGVRERNAQRTTACCTASGTRAEWRVLCLYSLHEPQSTLCFLARFLQSTSQQPIHNASPGHLRTLWADLSYPQQLTKSKPTCFHSLNPKGYINLTLTCIYALSIHMCLATSCSRFWKFIYLCMEGHECGVLRVSDIRWAGHCTREVPLCHKKACRSKSTSTCDSFRPQTSRHFSPWICFSS